MNAQIEAFKAQAVLLGYKLHKITPTSYDVYCPQNIAFLGNIMEFKGEIRTTSDLLDAILSVGNYEL